MQKIWLNKMEKNMKKGKYTGQIENLMKLSDENDNKMIKTIMK